MTSLLTKLRESEATTTGEALQRYGEILSRQQHPEPGDAAELKRLIEVLNLTDDQVEADCQVAQAVADHERIIADNTLSSDQQAAEREAMDKAAADADAARKAAEDAEFAKSHLWRTIQNRGRIIADTQGEIARLKRERPRAFGLTPAQPQGKQMLGRQSSFASQ